MTEILESFERLCVCARVSGLYKKEDEDVVKQALNRLEELEEKSKNPRTIKRFKIELQPMMKKQNVHYSNHIINYVSFNIRCWVNWDRLPITITDTQTNKKIKISKSNWTNWKEMICEWLGVPKEMLEVI